jgi:LacI family transcriptional regulator
MKLHTVTINDIALELGLSKSTVSKALSDSYEISEKTKKLVQAYAAERNFKPNILARSLKQGYTKSIGIVISTIDNNFFSQVIDGIESVAEEKGYNISITQTHESYEKEIRKVNHFSDRYIDGILISLSSETNDLQHLKSLQEKGLPIVFFDRVAKEINTHKVITDNFKGAYNGTQHLIEAGYKRIAHITSSRNLSITNERLAGYTAALKDHQLQPDSAYIKYCSHGGKNIEETATGVNELLALSPRPDAILTASDRITTQTLTLLNQAGIRIPQDIALIGFTNSKLADVLHPPLSAIVQPGFEIGKTAIELLINLIEAPRTVTQYNTVVIPTQMFVRASSIPV